jgi:hypothetical protein
MLFNDGESTADVTGYRFEWDANIIMNSKYGNCLLQFTVGSYSLQFMHSWYEVYNINAQLGGRILQLFHSHISYPKLHDAFRVNLEFGRVGEYTLQIIERI